MKRNNKFLQGRYCNRIIAIGSILFIFFSLLYIQEYKSNEQPLIHSSSLKSIVTKNGNQIRTEYVDNEGKITIAADLGYAIRIDTITNNRKLEQYYNDNFEPKRSNSKSYALLKEYNSIGKVQRYTYLDANGDPMINHAGYAIQVCEYNEHGNLSKEHYYGINGEPICTSSNAYGRIYEYDNNGKAYKLTYIDQEDKPMMIGLGYATIIRTFYSVDTPQNGRVENELYYDGTGEHIKLSLDQYGIHKEYDEYGRISTIVYLDDCLNPIETNKGYSTVKRTYNADNTLATELYFDLSGKPVSLSEGQYGYKIENGKTIFLDINGKEKFNIRNFVNNNSWVAIILSISIILVSVQISKQYNVLLLIIYLFAIAYFTMMHRNNTQNSSNSFFWQYHIILFDRKVGADILKNIWLFIPLGAILYQLNPQRTMLLIPVVLSILIEGIQYFTGLGFCELDDIINNGLGGCMGFYAGKLTNELILRIKGWKYFHTHKEGYES